MSGGFGSDWRNTESKEKDKYDQAEYMRRSTDAFNKIIADSTSNTLDLPSAYPFSAERYRYRINGNKYRDEDANTQISREEGSFILNPAQNDNIKFYGAERLRYVVGYEGIATIATKLNTSLETDDRIRIGLNDFQTPENGAFVELNGGSTSHRLVILNQGNEVATQNFELPDNYNILQPARWGIQFNWYGVGRFQFTLSYTDENNENGLKQEIVELGELAVDGDYSTSDPNTHVYAEIDTSNTGKEIEVGSLGYNVLGDTVPTTRIKSSRLTGLSYGGSGDYEALAAFRIDADFGNIFTKVAGIDVFPDSTEGELLAVAVSPANTDASGFSTPTQQSADNSILQETTSVSTFPGTASNPDGRQVSFASSDVTGQGRGTARSGFTQRDKRPIYEDDVVVILYKADTATADTVNIQYRTEQFW